MKRRAACITSPKLCRRCMWVSDTTAVAMLTSCVVRPPLSAFNAPPRAPLPLSHTHLLSACVHYPATALLYDRSTHQATKEHFGSIQYQVCVWPPSARGLRISPAGNTVLPRLYVCAPGWPRLSRKGIAC